MTLESGSLMQKFYVISDGDVFDVALRLALITEGGDMGLKVACRNLYKERRVEVIISGVDQAVKEFWLRVKGFDLRLFKRGEMYSVSELEPYDGVAPDWGYQTGTFIAEQMYKGTEYLGRVDEKLGKMDDKLGKVDEKLGKVDEKLGKVDEKLGKIDEKLDSLPERIAEAIKKK